MKEDKVANLSASTVGRMLNDLKKQRLLPQEPNLSYYANTDTFREKIALKRKKLSSKGYEGGLVKGADSMSASQMESSDTLSPPWTKKPNLHLPLPTKIPHQIHPRIL